jgi:hypothetical protein
MSASPIISGLMLFFSATTVAVTAYPIIKLLPSWLERSVYRKIATHRDAIAALDLAISRTIGDVEHRARLQAQADFHRNALARLAPSDAMLAPPQPIRFDAAA